MANVLHYSSVFAAEFSLFGVVTFATGLLCADLFVVLPLYVQLVPGVACPFQWRINNDNNNNSEFI